MQQAWEKRFHYVEWNGHLYKMYWRGALALALNRRVVSIRALEDKGILCTPTLKDNAGRWLYTWDQIDDLVKLAIEEGCDHPTPGKEFTKRFVAEAHKILKRKPQVEGRVDGDS